LPRCFAIINQCFVAAKAAHGEMVGRTSAR
jgi:hypothetical protein